MGTLEEEVRRFRLRLEAFLNLPCPERMPPALLAAAVEEVQNAAARVVLAIEPPDEQDELPSAIVIPVPLYVPRKHPDRDARIVLAALDYYNISQSSEELDHSRGTIRKVTELAYIAFLRGCRRRFGRRFESPPNNDQRHYPDDVLETRQRQK